MQAKFQESLKTEYNQEFINVMTLATIDELMESIRETPWKPWKKNQNFNYEEYKDELVDLFHFFMNLCLAVDMKADELYNRYHIKMETNKRRQREKY